jgi:hypothetical protein
LEKLPPINNSFLIMFDDTKPENNKFIRYKEEPSIDNEI